MSSKRPDHIDLGASRGFDPNRLGAPSPHDLPSPRSGEAPPALSPLDAFAFHSSVLARKFQEESEGRRISRLPPNTIAQELSKRRLYGAPRPPSSQVQRPAAPLASGNEPQLEKNALSKHRSVHPSISTFDDSASITETIQEAPEEETRSFQDYFGGKTARSTSPDSLPTKSRNVGNLEITTAGHTRFPAHNGSGDTYRQPLLNGSLAPPRSPASFQSRSPRSQSSIRPVRNDSGDDNSDSLSFLSDPYDSRYDRKPSTNSVSTRPRSPFSPTYAHGRSPSVTSEASTVASIAPRKSFNFSRPMSPSNRLNDQFETTHSHLAAEASSIRPSIDVVSIHDFVDSPLPPSQAFFDIAPKSNDTTPGDDAAANAGSYIYAKYALPRGRMVPRNSIGAEEFLGPKFNWDSPFLRGRNEVANAHSPSMSDVEDTPLGPPRFPSLTAPGVPQARASMTDVTVNVSTASQSSNHLRRPSADQIVGKRSMDALLPLEPPKLHVNRRTRKFSFGNREQRPQAKEHAARPTTSNSTAQSSLNAIELSKRLETAHTPTIDQNSPESHLAIGIECHEAGSLQKSTYHLRIAAKAGQPTAMLLYGLACRHGWGIRANPQEAFVWLRKAVDSAGLDVADDEALARFSQGPKDDVNSEFNSRKSHKAQLALAFYELGVSYMNGWGTVTDKSSAVRCFEIAGNWGDADALAEAGYCYAKGVGCKKDLARAASYYRKAADKGISMTGNSWIYKEKYDPKEPYERQGRGNEKDKEKKPRDKSRTRALFGGRKKATLGT